uniref:Cytochrome c6 n=1 Tax=Callithamnion tetricum TaxID=193179 RepID=A0A4D6WQM0_9FLOR|nr:cytochrome c553 [Callithamnion tetricum]
MSTINLILALQTEIVLAEDIDLDAGQQVFSANCMGCHAGGNNVLMPEKTLQKEALENFGMDNIQSITTQVTNGKMQMPAFGGRLTDEEINNVANYVLNQSKSGW